MQINYLRTCNLLLLKAKLSSLRAIYQMLTDNTSAAETINKAKINERIRNALDLDDSEITIDLREHNNGRPSKYDIFWEIAAQYLEGKVVDAVITVNERKHNSIIHLATAISVNDLLYKIKHECLSGILIPN